MLTTSHNTKDVIKNSIHTPPWMSLVDFTSRLQDQNWMGLDNLGNYDLVLFVGIPYPLGWLIFSSLKHFSSDLTTISLDRFYQPNVTCSFSNLKVTRWIESLKLIANALQGG
jgi:acetyl-CoA decarbonylase/synthase complex subunit epsilon